MAKKPTVVAANESANEDPFAGFNLVSLDNIPAPRKWESDPKKRLINKLEEQKAVLQAAINGEEFKRNGRKVAPWYVKAKDGSYQFFVSWAHDKLEFKPGMKAVAVANLPDMLEVPDRIIQLVKDDFFNDQMAKLSAGLGAKLKQAKKPAQAKAA
jgi:hypothetical protein